MTFSLVCHAGHAEISKGRKKITFEFHLDSLKSVWLMSNAKWVMRDDVIIKENILEGDK